jgi:hypothetical protein
MVQKQEILLRIIGNLKCKEWIPWFLALRESWVSVAVTVSEPIPPSFEPQLITAV